MALQQDERPIDPMRPIIDPHLHLWDIKGLPGEARVSQRYLVEEYQESLTGSGHNVMHTVFVECETMYRSDGPKELKSVGETEFANGMAAMSASGNYGPCRIAHRIVGNADLSLGARVERLLEAHQSAARERFCGIRAPVAFTEAGMFGHAPDYSRRHLMAQPRFREGARVLRDMGLSLDIWCFHTQLAELADLADAMPDLPIILDHVGTPESQGNFADRADDVREVWAKAIIEVARRPNVVVKIGGIGLDLVTPIGTKTVRLSSEALATKWRPYVETCLEAFTPRRCMFESNCPPANDEAAYGAIWNAFKRLAQSYSEDEKDSLFRRTAAIAYRISLDD